LDFGLSKGAGLDSTSSQSMGCELPLVFAHGISDQEQHSIDPPRYAGMTNSSSARDVLDSTNFVEAEFEGLLGLQYYSVQTGISIFS
jgi:hypothetical protein